MLSIIIPLSIMIVLTIFSVMLGNELTVVEEQGLLLEIDPFLGILGIIIGLTVVGGAIGFNLLGSGLNTASVKIIVLGAFYIVIWIFLSSISQPLIVEIEVFGTLLYLTITIWYAIGCIRQLAGAT